MQLHDYFKEQKQQQVSETQKFSIYKKIIEQKSEKNHMRKRSLLHIKSLAYWLTLTIFIVAMYWTFFMQDKINFNENWIIIQPKIIRWVDADYIANIVNFEGNFVIEHNWKQLQTSNIRNWDTVILPENTDMIFHIDEKTQTKVTWPAKFVLYKYHDKYKIELKYGDFVEIQSLTENNKENIEIQSNGVLISQKKSNEAANFQLIKKDGKQIVKNNWESDISVKINKKQTEIHTAQLAQIENDDISLLKIEDIEEAIQEKRISQTFTWKNKSDENNIQKTEEILVQHELTWIQLTWILATQSGKIDQVVTKELGINENEKMLLSLEDNNKLYWLLNQSFIKKDFEKLSTYAIDQNSKEFNIAYNNLEYRIKQIYQVFDLTYSDSRGDFYKLKSNITSLSSQQEKYLLPPKYAETLNYINNQINQLLQTQINTETWTITE